MALVHCNLQFTPLVVVAVIVQLLIIISESIMAFAQCSNAVLECRGVAVGIVGLFL